MFTTENLIRRLKDVEKDMFCWNPCVVESGAYLDPLTQRILGCTHRDYVQTTLEGCNLGGHTVFVVEWDWNGATLEHIAQCGSLDREVVRRVLENISSNEVTHIDKSGLQAWTPKIDRLLEYGRAERLKLPSGERLNFRVQMVPGDNVDKHRATVVIGRPRDEAIIADDLAIQIRLLKDVASSLADELGRDPLTNLLNRRGLVHEFALLQKGFRRNFKSNSGRCIFSIVFDIDHFKAVNDTHGHTLGDEILKLVASVFKEMGRETDLVGRIGGEEFMWIGVCKNLKEAMHLAEKLRRRIELTPYNISLAAIGKDGKLSSYAGQSLKTTVTLGVAVDPSGREALGLLAQKGTTPYLSLNSRADMALYSGKGQTRNVVVGYAGEQKFVVLKDYGRGNWELVTLPPDSPRLQKPVPAICFPPTP